MRSAALTSLLVLAACLDPLGPAADGGPAPDAGPLAPLRINEVMARNATAHFDELGEPDDWIELTNIGLSALSLDGLTLSDDVALARFALPAVTLDPGAHLVVFADAQPEQGPLHAPFRLASGGESLFLRDDEGRLVDEVRYSELAIDQSAGRARDEGPLVTLAIPTPGARNGLAAARPERPASEGVVVNELLAQNDSGLLDEAGELADWVELHNTSPVEQDLGFHHLSDSASAPFLFTLPSELRVPPGGFVVVFLDGEPHQGPLHAGFGLDVAGDRVALHAPDGALLDEVDFGPQIPDLALARRADGSFAPAAPSPGAANPE